MELAALVSDCGGWVPRHRDAAALVRSILEVVDAMSPRPDLSSWLNTEQVCAQLGISQRSLSRLVKEGKLTPRKEGKLYFFDPEQVRSLQRAPVMTVQRAVSQPPQPPAIQPQPPVVAGMAGEMEDNPLVAALERLLHNYLPPPEPEPLPMFVDVPTASRHTGISDRGLMRIKNAGGVVAIFDERKTKLRTSDLETMDVSVLQGKPREVKAKKARKVKRA